MLTIFCPCVRASTHVTYLCGLYDNRERVISGGSKRRGVERRGGQARTGEERQRRREERNCLRTASLVASHL